MISALSRLILTPSRRAGRAARACAPGRLALGRAGATACLAAALSAACAPAPAAPAAAAATSPRPAPTMRPLTATYLGVAGWTLSDGQHTVASDPYFTRPSFAAGVPVAPDEAAIAAHTPARLDLIVVGHSHVDHVLDTPALARRTGAQVLGSISTANYARALGLPDQQIVPVQGGEDYAFDGFSVRVMKGLHSALGDKHSRSAFTAISSSDKIPTTMDEFGEGGALHYLVRLGGHQVLIIGSANYIERELDGLRPDIAIVATGLRQQIYDYTCRLMKALGNPPIVLTNHFDSWTKPASTPLAPDTLADLEAFTAEVRACSPGTRVIVPRPFEPMTF